MKVYRLKKRLLFYSIAVLLCIPLPSLLWVAQPSSIYLTGGACVLCALCVVCLVHIEKKYQSRMIIQLSDLISNITELREEIIFPENEDTLLSKLQNQVLHLSGILKHQRAITANEKAQLEGIIADLSHQLKTPIATLSVYGELLQEENLSPTDTQVYLEALNASVRKLNFLIDSLIKMGRLETGLIHLNPAANSLNELLLTAIKEVMGKAKLKQIAIAFEQKKELEAVFDKRWTKEAIFNILENSVKYTPSGGHVAITIHPYELFIRLDITDDGIGIPEQEQPKIFTRFYRGAGSDEEEGIGIGLYLSRKIITEQGGYIKLSSGAGGSCFSVFLPAVSMF